MAVFEMLPEMVGTKEFLALIAFTELVYVIQMFYPSVPVRWIRKFLTTVATGVGVRAIGELGALRGWRGSGSVSHIGVHGGMEGFFE